METSLEWQLKLIPWDFFATLTWEDVETTSPSSRRHHVAHWIDRWAARVCGLKSQHIAWATRWERGEIGDRPHCHLLIGRIPRRHISITVTYILKHIWQHRPTCICTPGKKHKEMCGHGLAQIRLYDPSAAGVPYMCKGKVGSDWSYSGANAYELRKYNSVDLDALYISPRAQQEMVEARTVARRLSPVD
jgi:hypothetical protein